MPRAVKLSSKGRYAVGALFDIAFYNEGGPTQVRDIATRQGIPLRFLEQIFQDLKRAKIVVSKRGPQGGYRLALPAEDVRLGDVVRAIEGPVQLSDTGEARGGNKPKEALDSRRVSDDVFEKLSVEIERCLDSISIADMCTRAGELGINKPISRAHVYVI